MPAGKGVHVPFRLGGDHGLDILASGSPQSSPHACTPGAPEDKVEATVKISKSKLTYQPRPDKYLYFWATQASWRGECRELVLRLSDGSEHRALFRFT